MKLYGYDDMINGEKNICKKVVIKFGYEKNTKSVYVSLIWHFANNIFVKI